MHGLPGLIGALAIGFLSDSMVNAAVAGDGLVFGGSASLFGEQVLACVVVAAYSALVAAGLAFLLRRDVLKHNTTPGLDILDHAMRATCEDHHVAPSEVSPLLGINHTN